ncbi:N-acetylmuramoyl-L-alanine amidase [Flavobacterium sp. DG1-102-2]|uniref:N-acetylmuramoyl-L-alanine amidase n=1 Tax=Flavobacterium sp. DG1-102-2 TaxID=3081663 RepID=UPI002949600F|nr:N-acetylmuramoyl-L-alanine amidase [Flavobacterium sp. DG1-102-2]MDV6170230.1 N-acetylmuramoyl-L-alanine amidase [Flavobacterium sp. DG1-102-2]
MRQIKFIAIHCSATAQSAKVESIQKYWREVLKWSMPGYHFIVEANGTVHNLLPIENVSNGVAGYNSQTINICYIGGVDKKNKPIDNRTPEQKAAMLDLVKKHKKLFPHAIVQGHRDFPKVAKACPCFDAKPEYANV